MHLINNDRMVNFTLGMDQDSSLEPVRINTMIQLNFNHQILKILNGSMCSFK